MRKALTVPLDFTDMRIHTGEGTRIYTMWERLQPQIFPVLHNRINIKTQIMSVLQIPARIQQGYSKDI